MKKRYTDCDIWEDDFFQKLSPAHKLFWFYLCNKCDHAGIWKPNVINFEAVTGIKIRLPRFLELINKGKVRVVKLGSGRWHVVDFCHFQYMSANGGVKSGMNIENKVHLSALEILNKNGINIMNLIPKGREKEYLCRISTELLQSFCLKEEVQDKEKEKKLLVKGNVRTEPAPCERCGHSVSAKEWNEGHEEKCKRKNPLSHVPGNVQAVIK